MCRTMLKSKIAYAKVTKSDLYYDGSMGIDEEFMIQTDLKEYEQIHVLNVTNGERFITYVIKEEKGSKKFNVYGAAAKKVSLGDELIILSFTQVLDENGTNKKPVVLNFKEAYTNG